MARGSLCAGEALLRQTADVASVRGGVWTPRTLQAKTHSKRTVRNHAISSPVQETVSLRHKSTHEVTPET